MLVNLKTGIISSPNRKESGGVLFGKTNVFGNMKYLFYTIEIVRKKSITSARQLINLVYITGLPFNLKKQYQNYHIKLLKMSKD